MRTTTGDDYLGGDLILAISKALSECSNIMINASNKDDSRIIRQ